MSPGTIALIVVAVSVRRSASACVPWTWSTGSTSSRASTPPVARFQHREIGGQVCVRPRVRLNVRMFGAEEGLCPLDGVFGGQARVLGEDEGQRAGAQLSGLLADDP